MNKLLTLSCIKKDMAKILPLDLVKAYLKITNDYEDEVLESIIDSVITVCENHTSLIFSKQVWVAIYKCLTEQNLILPISPVGKIIAINTKDDYGKTTEINLKSLELNAASSLITFKQPPFGKQLMVTFEAGPIDAYLLKDIKLIMLSHIAYCYENRALADKFCLSSYDAYKSYKL